MKISETAALEALRALGLSESGLLHSTGIERHLARLRAGEIQSETLAKYAADLATLKSGGTAGIPVNFWDVRSPTMTAQNVSEYGLVNILANPKYAPYRALLAQSYAHFLSKEAAGKSALSAALDILRAAAAYVHAGHTLIMTASLPHLNPEQNTFFLWQQLLTGANRAIPVLGNFYSHGIWARFNMVEIQRYATGRDLEPNSTWGVSGFSQAFVGHEHNNNQVEHMAISAVSSAILRVPLIALNLFEVASWMPLRRAPYGEMRGDINLNNAVVYELFPGFTAANPEPAITRFAKAVGN